MEALSRISKTCYQKNVKMKRSITFQAQPLYHWVRKEKIENKEYVSLYSR